MKATPEGLVDLSVNIIDKTDIHNTANREAYFQMIEFTRFYYVIIMHQY